MKSINLRRRIAAGLSALGLLSGLVVASGASAVHAAGAVQYPSVRFTITNDSSAGTFTILDQQTVSLRYYGGVNSSWSGWTADTRPSLFSLAQFTTGTLPGGVSVVSTMYSYYFNYQGETPNPSCSANGSSATYTLPADKTCVNALDYSKTITLRNTSGSTVNIDLPVETAKILIDSVEVTPNYPGFDPSVSLTLTGSGTTIPTNALNGSLSFNGCYDSGVSIGDELNVTKVVKIGGADIAVYTDGVPPSAPYVNIYSGGIGSADTYTTTSSTSFYVSWSLVLDDASKGQNLTASLDMKKAGASVLTTCGGGGGGMPTYPTLSALTGGTAVGNASLSAAKALVTGIPAPDGMNMPSSSVGPDGDVFYMVGDGTNAYVTRIKASGNQNIAGAAKLVQALQDSEMPMDFGWYGAARDKWVLVAQGMTGFSVYYGNLGNSSGKSRKTLDAAKIDAICGDGYFGMLNVISAPTTSPVVSVNCQPMEYGPTAVYFNAFAKLTPVVATPSALDLSVYTELKKPTDTLKCQYASVGTDAGATGTEAAVFMYVAIGARPVSGPCDGTNASNRTIVTLSTTMTKKVTTMSTAKFGAKESTYMSIGPAKAAGAWLVISNPLTDTGRKPGQGYIVSANGTVTAKKTVATLTAVGSAFAAPGGAIQDTLTPLKELTGGNWLVLRQQRAMGMAAYQTLAIAKYNPSTGAVTTGAPLKVTGTSLYGAYITSVGISLSGTLSYFALTEAGKYKVATWKSYTS